MSDTKGKTLVLYAPYRDLDVSVPLTPKERYQEVMAVKCERSRCEKYLVWKLLQRAVMERFNLVFDNIRFTKTDNGKWICPEFCFSLSHTDGVVCVAVSDSDVGVDIEAVRAVKEGMHERFLTDKEREHIRSLSGAERDRFFLGAWVKKESLFKRDGSLALLPTKTQTIGCSAILESVTVGGKEYFVAVAASDNEKIEIRYTEEI